jgi:thiamine kinase
MAAQLTRAQHALATALCQNFRAWAPSEPRAPRVGRCLEHGLSNRSVLLRGARRRYVLRIAEAATPAGVNRERELRLLCAASARHIAPTPLLCDPARGVLITAVAGEAVSSPALPELAVLLRAIHALPARGQPLCSADALAHYRRGLAPDTRTARLLQNAAAALRGATETVRGGRSPAVTCHNDLLAANLRSVGSRLLALDWEYACTGDAFFDLAVCAWERDDETAVRALLEAYLQRRPTPAEAARLAAQRLLYAAIDACWRERYAADEGLAVSQARLRRALAGFS